MLTVLVNTSVNHHNSGPDERIFLKEVMASLYWKHCVVFRPLLDNLTWEYRNASPGRAVLTGLWVFKVKNDRWGKISRSRLDG